LVIDRPHLLVVFVDEVVVVAVLRAPSKVIRSVIYALLRRATKLENFKK